MMGQSLGHIYSYFPIQSISSCLASGFFVNSVYVGRLLLLANTFGSFFRAYHSSGDVRKARGERRSDKQGSVPVAVAPEDSIVTCTLQARHRT